jgi:hypothetical protein
VFPYRNSRSADFRPSLFDSCRSGDPQTTVLCKISSMKIVRFLNNRTTLFSFHCMFWPFFLKLLQNFGLLISK